MKIESFKDLIVWQKFMELSKRIYNITSQIPKEEQSGLISQMRRSSISIPSNIAEGSKRGTRKDYVQFLKIANGSAAELETQLLLAEDLYKLRNIDDVWSLLEEVQKMLNVLIRKLTTT